MSSANCTLDAASLAEIESRTQEIGRWLFDHLKVERPSMLQRRWWDDQIMRFAMRDEQLKTELFRFVDVLPMLRDSKDLFQHLTEYLGQARHALPTGARTALNVADKTPFARAAIARTARLTARDFARRFIAGENTKEVIAAAKREREHGRAFTLDILGEAVISEVEAERFFRAYADLIEGVAPTVNQWDEVAATDIGLHGPLPRMNLSIKLSALDSQFDAIDVQGSMRRAGERFRQLLRIARENRAFINVDMECYDKKDLTLHIFKQVLSEREFIDVDDVGIVIQCYLKDAGDDLVALRDWAQNRGKPIWVRLVKGAYWDYETVHAGSHGWPVPVFQQKWQSDVNFEEQTRFVIQNREHLRPALASHNLRSLAYGMAVAEHFELPNHALEIQMLFGMADAEKHAIVDRGHRLRIYMPYGELIPGMAYLVRRLLENTSNDSFVRVGFDKGVQASDLLHNPVEVGRQRERDADTSLSSSESEPPMENRSLRATFANEPPIDFADEENRQKMEQAIAAVEAKLGRHFPLVINGRQLETDETITSLNPSDLSQVVGTAASATVTHTNEAVEAAAAALPQWSGLGAEKRATVLHKAAQIMRDRVFELSAWIVLECGKGWRSATDDVCEAIDFCDFYANNAVAMEQPRGADAPGEQNRFEYLPRGVAVIISPWNFPLAILTGMTAAALATGNTAIMKPAEQSSVIGGLLMEIFQSAGAPAGAVNFLPGKGETVGAALVEHPQTAIIAFTGSRQVGLQIHAKAAAVSASGIKFVKKVIAEMGGKNGLIVDDDADLDEAVLGVMKSAFGFQGQKCSACSRAIVLEKIYDEFVDRLVEATRSLLVGPAIDPATSVGPLIDRQAQNKTLEYVALGKQEGREVLAEDVGALAEQGCFVGPHIFADIPPDARLAQEEIFGPVLAVIKAKDFDDAIAIANGTDYALTAGAFSRSPKNLERARRELIAGNVYLNRTITGALVGRQPFGGFRMSGIGSKAGGDDYLLQFVLPRTVTENTMRRGFAPPDME